MEKFLKIAHRGYSSDYPENTMLAFAKAVEGGADMVELDVHLSRDGRLVVIHDDRIDRTADGTGKVEELSLAELRRFNYNNGMARHGFTGIPTLDEVIAWAPAGLTVNVEIKSPPAGSAEGVQRLAALLARSGFVDRVVVSSFDHLALAEMKRVAPAVRRAMLYDAVWLTFEEEVRTLSLYSVHPGKEGIHPGQLAWAKSQGIRVYPWVVKDRETLEAYRGSGYVDGAIVNDLALFTAP